jgi:sigma-54 specific flagellar transcriptional regulator A
VVLEVPPLRDRLSDLPALAAALLEQSERSTGVAPKPLSRHAIDALGRYGWPGNVRELDNALRVASLFATDREIQLADLTDNVDGLRALGGAQPSAGRPATLPPPASSGASLAAHSSAGPTGPGPETLPSGEVALGVSSGNSGDLVYAEVRQGTSLADMKRKLEQECIARALVESGGNITRAAALLGMKRPRLSQLVKQYQLGTVVEESKS